MRMTKKIIAIALSFLMAVSMMPFTVFAATTLDVATGADFKTAIANAQAGDTIRFTADVDMTAKQVGVEIDKDLTIDLNGKTVTAIANGSVGKAVDPLNKTEVMFIRNSNNLVLTDSVGGGSWTYTYGANSAAYFVDIRDNATVTVNGGSYASSNANYGGYIFYVRGADAKLIINDGNFALEGTRRDGIVYNYAGSTEINGGTFTTGKATDYAVYSGSKASTAINDGDFTGTISGTAGKTVVNGGTFVKNDGTVNNVSKYLAEGLAQNEDGTVAVLPTATVEEIEAPEGLEAAYLFKANDDEDSVQNSAYKDYLADFVISFDQDITENDVKVGGAYAAYDNGNWQIFNAPALAAGQEYRLLQDGVSAMLGRDISMTYEEICTIVKEFKCGIAGLNAAGITANVKLNLYKTADSEPITIESGSISYTFPEEISLQGTVDAYTQTATISNPNEQTVQVIIRNPVINYSPADPSVGRNQEGYWAGIKVTAPNGLTADATYTSGGTTKSFAENKDGDNYIGLWINLIDVANAVAAGHEWQSGTYTFDWNGDGTTDQTVRFYVYLPSVTLVKDNQQVYPAVADDEFQVTVEDTLDFTLYIADSATADHVEFVFNGTPDVEENNTAIVTAYDAIDGFYDYSLNLAPAQIKDDITVTVYDANDAVVRSFTTSVADYCLAMKDDATYGQLAKAIYDYGKAAAAYFDYNADAYTDDYNFTTADFSAYDLAADDTTGKVANVSYVATSEPALRFIMNLTEEEAAALTASANIGTASFVKVNGNVVLQVKDIPASKLGETITVTVDGLGTVTYTPIIYAKKAAANNDALGRLGVSIANYNQAAAALA